MRTATKKFIAGTSLLACLLVLVTGAVQGLPLWIVLERTALATAVFGTAGWIGGLAYEKIWLK